MSTASSATAELEGLSLEFHDAFSQVENQPPLFLASKGVGGVVSLSTLEALIPSPASDLVVLNLRGGW